MILVKFFLKYQGGVGGWGGGGGGGWANGLPPEKTTLKKPRFIRVNGERSGTFQRSIIDAIYSIRNSIKSPDIIFKALVKHNATNLDIHSVEEEVENR